MSPGLVSVTFRKLGTLDVIRLTAQARLECIEWGGDLHVPHGEVATAREVGRATREAGLSVAAYGSYFRLGEGEDFGPVLDTAAALEAPLIRVWPGRQGSDKADTASREKVAQDGRNAAEKAAEAGIALACEWHGNTLTDTPQSAAALFSAVNHSAFHTYWQPHQRMPHEECLRDLETALPRLAGLHVFHWHPGTAERLPLEEGQKPWRAYLQRAATAGDLPVLLEFVRNDEPDQFLRDAAALREWLEQRDDAPDGAAN